MNFDKSTFTWGYEIEWGDVDRRLTIPPELGKWEYSETDIVNMHEPYRYRACDPLGLEPPFGGEINVMPTKTKEELLARVKAIHDWFVEQGNQPTPSFLSHIHVHVHVPGLTKDIDALKRLVSYIKNNQHETIYHAHAFREHPLMKDGKGAKTYLKWDGGRPMPDYICDNIVKLATDFEHFIKLHAAGKDGVSMGRPFRYAINTYCLKHTGTVEFRLFRNTLDWDKIADILKFVEEFLNGALNTNKQVSEILAEYDYKFPELEYDHAAWVGWEKTKYDKSRGKKQREFHEVG